MNESITLDKPKTIKVFTDWHVDEVTNRKAARVYAVRLWDRLAKEARTTQDEAAANPLLVHAVRVLVAEDMALNQVQQLLNRTEWNADTLSQIAAIIRGTGRKIEELA